MNKSVLRLAIPSIFANITVPLVGLVDLVIAGRLGNAALIGGIAISTMLFDLLYWNMAFLRLGTGGVIAQSYGRRDFKEAMKVFVMGLATAFAIALLVWAIQFLYLDIVFSFIDCSSEVEQLARDYFFIRVWAAPATLSLYVFKGFFIGMQNAISPMVVDVTVNITNLVASLYFALYAGMGFSGIAMGTVVAQYIGFFLSIILVCVYYKKLFKYIDVKESVKFSYLKRFFALNSDLFIRSFSFLFIYAGFTSLSARFGDVLLASGTILMKIMMLFSYFVDGFAYAGEALTGRFIGAKDKKMLKSAIRVIFYWGLGIGVLSGIIYFICGDWLLEVMTTDVEVVEASKAFLPWLWIMPFISCVAFTWDGIFIGATATRPIRDSMVWSVVGFFVVFYAMGEMVSMHGLWMAYMVHLLIRSLYLSLTAKRWVYNAF